MSDMTLRLSKRAWMKDCVDIGAGKGENGRRKYDIGVCTEYLFAGIPEWRLPLQRNETGRSAAEFRDLRAGGQTMPEDPVGLVG